ncbi:uncharacterized protein LOC141605770 [Silene latifolia]|uniref:uncharacterized protein LOC141605770 n=1 Tax=Silene latifolia TaxID=37657 RepID=UPI003D7789DC
MVKGKRMRGGRKTESVTVQKKHTKKLTVNSQPWSARNLVKKDLASVIFACKKSTFRECISKQLFGLPGAHFAYVQNVTVGMPLFLFNCTDRKLFGIFEAVSLGQMNIDKHAWTSDASETTPFPAQVRVKIQKLCQPLNEEQYKSILLKNYHQDDPNYFWFELDQTQTQKLISTLSLSLAVPSTSKTPSIKWGNLLKKSIEEIARQEAPNSDKTSVQIFPESSSTTFVKGKEVAKDNVTSYAEGKSWSSLFKPQSPLLEEETEDSESENSVSENSETDSLYTVSENAPSTVNEASFGVPEAPPTIVSETTSSAGEASGEMSSEVNSDICAIFDKLLQAVEEIKIIQLAQTQKMESMDLELVEVNNRLKRLESDHGKSGSSSRSLSDDCCQSCDHIILVGGFDGSSWLQDLVSYLPSVDLIRPLVPMSSIRPYASAVELNGEVFVLGGGGQGTSWYDTVESYNLGQRQWVKRPELSTKKGSLAGASLLSKIFAIGGGNDTGCLSEVEVLDLNIGKWMVTRSMSHKRFSSAAAELNGVLYVAGGYDGQEYLRSVERYDPRVYSWMKLGSLNTRRGCHSLAVLNDKLYAIGGYDGAEMVPTVEVFEPRVGSWTMSESLTCARGYMGAATLGNTIYAIGGMMDNSQILDTVECYSEGEGWQLANLKSVGKRCFFSAVACNK